MLHIGFKLYNPFSQRFKTLYYRNGFVTKHKGVELQLMETNYILEFEFSFTTRTDHAGINLDLSLFGYTLNLNMHDIRHWDHQNNTWKELDKW
jgi:hypothetical protein